MVLVKQSIGLGNYCELLKNRNEVEGIVLEVEKKLFVEFNIDAMNVLNMLVVPKKYAFIIKSIPNIVKKTTIILKILLKHFLRVQTIWQ
jgi:hypothetical protein